MSPIDSFQTTPQITNRHARVQTMHIVVFHWAFAVMLRKGAFAVGKFPKLGLKQLLVRGDGLAAFRRNHEHAIVVLAVRLHVVMALAALPAPLRVCCHPDVDPQHERLHRDGDDRSPDRVEQQPRLPKRETHLLVLDKVSAIIPKLPFSGLAAMLAQEQANLTTSCSEVWIRSAICSLPFRHFHLDPPQAPRCCRDCSFCCSSRRRSARGVYLRN